MTPAFAPAKAIARAAHRRMQATAIVTALPLIALAFASLDSAMVYAVGRLLQAIGAR